MSKPKVIAFYLPQFHPTSDNDKWWGKGFTEWTNVGKAKPLFKGHYQPKVPADLGYYDLRLPEVRKAQVELAKEAGIYGFCYYHYWFGNGKQELEFPFNEVVKSGKPDFPFMLCWANESWHKKFWDKDALGSKYELLLEQTYPGVEDYICHFYNLLPAFKDPRYIKIEGRNAFMVYKPCQFPGLKDFIYLWNKLAKQENLPEFYFIGHIQDPVNKNILDELTSYGLNGINTAGVYYGKKLYYNNLINKLKLKFSKIILKRPFIIPYKKIYPLFKSPIDEFENVFPTIIPNWDHTPRSGRNGYVVTNSSPKLFFKHIMDIFNIVKHKKNPVVFLKSWNEWGEGNYMEPDLKFGKGYIQALRKALDQIKE